jgi:hypothetical protein
MNAGTIPPFARGPKTRPPIEERDLEPFDWYLLIDRCVHELKIAIAEALDWIGQPLSAKELWLVLGPEEHKYHDVHYHVTKLREQGLTVEAGERLARGATEIYYLGSGN